MPFIPLNRDKICALLHDSAIHLEIFERIDSTSAALKSLAPQRHAQPVVYIAEMQTQGQGRFGRHWHSPFGENIYLSLRYPIPMSNDLQAQSGLSLIIGLAAAQAITLHSCLANPIWVKWPNDIVYHHRKMGGVLAELQTQVEQTVCQLIIGVGINVNMLATNANDTACIAQPWTSIRQQTDQYHDRNVLCAELINQILQYLARFMVSGLGDFQQEWATRDYLLHRSVCLSTHQQTVKGIGSGIDPAGHLVLTLPNNQQQSFAAGEATLI